MSYINVETAGASFRYITDWHSIPVNPSQLHPNSSGISIELMVIDPEDVFKYIRADQELVWGKAGGLDEVREQAISNKIPLGTFHPLFTHQGIYRVAYEFNSARRECDTTVLAETKKILIEVSRAVSEVSKNDPVVAELREGVASITGKEEAQVVRLIDLVVAEKGIAFAEHQKNLGVVEPVINIICGTGHIGVVTALEMESSARRSSILEHPLTSVYFNRTELSKGYYIQADNSNRDIKEKIFEIPSLK